MLWASRRLDQKTNANKKTCINKKTTPPCPVMVLGHLNVSIFASCQNMLLPVKNEPAPATPSEFKMQKAPGTWWHWRHFFFFKQKIVPPFVPFKSIKLIMLSKDMRSRRCRLSHEQRRTAKLRVQPQRRWESARWHAGQGVLTLQVNRWKALEETTVSCKAKKKYSKAHSGLVLLEQTCRKA